MDKEKDKNKLPSPPARVTENEYLELAKSFQEIVTEKNGKIKALEVKVDQAHEKVELLLQTKSTLRRGYMRALNELAELKLPRDRRAKFATRLVHNLVDLHSFIMNENVLDDIEAMTDMSSSEEDEEDED